MHSYLFDQRTNLHRDTTSHFNREALSQAIVRTRNQINGSNSSDSIKSPYQKAGEPIIPILFRALPARTRRNYCLVVVLARTRERYMHFY